MLSFMFDRLIGNDRAKDVLRRMLAEGRVPGALLFVGEDGVGKKPFALELAKALNCRARVGAEGCDRCSSCLRIMESKADGDAAQQIAWSEHPDVGLIRATGRFITVPQIRDLEREANFRPFEGAARVFIIEDADEMNETAANALLKTLEEPPSASHLILLTSYPANLLPTIRSRCQLVRFTPLSVAEIEAFLKNSETAKKSTPKNKADVATQDIALVARLARGSLGRAFALDLTRYREGRALAESIIEAIVVTRDRARLLRVAEELNDPKYKDEYETRLEILETLIHDLWLMSAAGNSPQNASIVNDDIRAQLARLSAALNDLGISRVAMRWLTEIETVRHQLGVNINRKIATDALLLTMASAAEVA